MPFPPRVIFCVLHRARTRVSRPYFMERGYWHSVCMRIYGIRSGENCSETRKLFSVTASCVQKKGLRMALYNFPAFFDATGGKGYYAVFFVFLLVISSKENWPPHEYRMQANVWQESYFLHFYRNYRNDEDLPRGNWAAWIYKISIPSTGKKSFFLKKSCCIFSIFSSWSYEGSDWWKVRS